MQRCAFRCHLPSSTPSLKQASKQLAPNSLNRRRPWKSPGGRPVTSTLGLGLGLPRWFARTNRLSGRRKKLLRAIPRTSIPTGDPSYDSLVRALSVCDKPFFNGRRNNSLATCESTVVPFLRPSQAAITSQTNRIIPHHIILLSNHDIGGLVS